jgi:Family of unknown function (DUF5678)
MTTFTYNLAELVRPYENQWVALTPDYRQVIASGETLDEVESRVEGKDLTHLVFFKVPRFDAVFIPATL